ncbi:MAG: LuxR family transcriptional regulator [Rhodoferax sp.]|nr:LuxR family transcriptional regulator [Rhodoferax sp.]
MRQWPSPRSATSAMPNPFHAPVGAGAQGFASTGQALGGMIQRLGEDGFEAGVLASLQPLLPVASWSVYRTGPRCRPTLFMSASLGIPDTTRECWWAYLSGPYLHDRTWGGPAGASQGALQKAEVPAPAAQLCHITAQEVGGEHQARVYEAHGMVERVSIFEPEADGSLFAVNFYRHQHQAPLSDVQIGDFEGLAPALLALARKHIALTQTGRPATPPNALANAVANGAANRAANGAASAGAAAGVAAQGWPPGLHAMAPAVLRERLLQASAGLTARELDVCVRMLQGMTQEGIACDLGLSVPTVKTYRNRAFARLGGIHFRNELFALVWRGNAVAADAH